ncbi:glycine-rich cell wall structural protein 1.8-like [Arachis stenosperma]|uniref:glycine-rich cell wall structural protein 1.8-like n=1 Tax=Arachis stenosperma TaxID=217475 RepID=UPI0025ABD4C0|nr:glycine-rich cell wall structural protein 1.8-like [Arachis stenosperma]
MKEIEAERWLGNGGGGVRHGGGGWRSDGGCWLGVGASGKGGVMGVGERFGTGVRVVVMGGWSAAVMAVRWVAIAEGGSAAVEGEGERRGRKRGKEEGGGVAVGSGWSTRAAVVR